MISDTAPNPRAPSVHKNEQQTQKSEPPPQAMSLPVLKAIEQRLIERGLLRKEHSCYPLWFLAENERNLFLWRNGCSLAQQDRFEFWVDIDRLVHKRREALRGGEGAVTSGWDTSAGDRDLAEREQEYLDTLVRLLLKIGSHAHALSQVGLMVEKEVTRAGKSRRMIVLPNGSFKERPPKAPRSSQIGPG